MEVVVIDGQGGGIGRSVIEALKKEVSGTFIIAVGTNSTATNNMKKGFVFANSMYGEVSPAMAAAISCSEAQKYFIPVSKCTGHVLGVEPKSIQEYIRDLVNILK